MLITGLTCPECGQRMFVRTVNSEFAADRVGPCNVCVERKCEREHAPQGEKVRLFEPAPNQMPGQLAF